MFLFCCQSTTATHEVKRRNATCARVSEGASRSVCFSHGFAAHSRLLAPIAPCRVQQVLAQRRVRHLDWRHLASSGRRFRRCRMTPTLGWSSLTARPVTAWTWTSCMCFQMVPPAPSPAAPPAQLPPHELALTKQPRRRPMAAARLAREVRQGRAGAPGERRESTARLAQESHQRRRFSA